MSDTRSRSGGHADLVSGQPVVEILAELPLGDEPLDVAMRRRNQPDVDAVALLRPERR